MYKQIVLFFLLAFTISLQAQEIALKTNLLYLETTTPNVGLEFSLNKKLSVDLTAGYNPWHFRNNSSLRHWLVQPELRYWQNQSFEGYFVGLYAMHSKFQVGKIAFINSMKNYIYDGSLYGAGIAYGYRFPLNEIWSMEITAGLGYLNLNYDKYRCKDCLDLEGSYKHGYWGPTKASISIIYKLK